MTIEVLTEAGLLQALLLPEKSKQEATPCGTPSTCGSPTTGADVVPTPLQTNGEACVNLLNYCLGSGMLSIGFAMAKAGLLGGLILLVCSTLLNRFTLLLNVRTCKLAKCDPATCAMAELAFGLPGRLLMTTTYAMVGFLAMVSYIDAAADAMEGLLALAVGEAAVPSHTTVLIGCWLFLHVPPTLVRSLKDVAKISFVAFSGGVVLLGAVAFACGARILDHPPSLAELKLFPNSSADLLTALPILMLCLSVQAGGGVVLATMENDSVSNVTKVSSMSFLLVFVMDLTIGVLSYLCFLGETQGDVMKSFPATDPAAIVGRVALLDLMVLSYTVYVIPCKVSLIDSLFGKNEALQESSWAQFYGTTMALNLAALAVSLVVSDVSLVTGLNGAVFINFVAFIMPPLFSMRLRAKLPDRTGETVPLLSWSNVPLVAILLYGVASLLLATSQLLLRVWPGG